MSRIPSLAVGIFVVATALPAGAQPLSALPQLRGGAVPLATRVPTRLATRLAAFGTIQGNAMRGSGSLANGMIRLRDARFGRIVDTQLSDKAGAFAFRGLDPGSYIVEIVSTSQSTIAATQMINVSAGETITAVVRVPIRPSMFAGILGQQGATGAAAPAGVTEIIPAVVEQLPQAAIQSIPAVVPVAQPVSSR